MLSLYFSIFFYNIQLFLNNKQAYFEKLIQSHKDHYIKNHYNIESTCWSWNFHLNLNLSEMFYFYHIVILVSLLTLTTQHILSLKITKWHICLYWYFSHLNFKNHCTVLKTNITRYGIRKGSFATPLLTFNNCTTMISWYGCVIIFFTLIWM